MALLWCDGFEGYGSLGEPTPTDVMADKYVYVFDEDKLDILTANARTDRSLRIPTNSTSFVQFRTPDVASGNTFICGVGLRFPFAPTFTTGSYWTLFSFYNASTNRCATLSVADSGLYVHDASGAIIGGTRCNMILLDWYYVEVKIYSHATTGTIEIRVNGCPTFSGSSLNTLNTGGAITKIAIGGTRRVRRKASSLLDDFYICDGTGSTNNDFLGPVTVRTLYPDGDDTAQFATTGNANYATHYEQLNDDHESYPTTDYVEDGSTGNRDIYTLDNSTDNFATVYGMVGWAYAQYESGATAYRLVCDSNGTENESSNIDAESAFHYDSFVLETDPDTSSAWTDSTINAAKFGFEVQ